MSGQEKIVLISLTGWGAPDDRGRSRHAGFHHHLTKPAELAALDVLLSKLNLDESITEKPVVVT